jgi:hypothetical protein
MTKRVSDRQSNTFILRVGSCESHNVSCVVVVELAESWSSGRDLSVEFRAGASHCTQTGSRLARKFERRLQPTFSISIFSPSIHLVVIYSTGQLFQRIAFLLKLNFTKFWLHYTCTHTHTHTHWPDYDLCHETLNGIFGVGSLWLACVFGVR